MKVTDIETLIVSLGGEVPDGLKEIKEALAAELATAYLVEHGKAVDGLDLDEMKLAIDEIDAQLKAGGGTVGSQIIGDGLGEVNGQLKPDGDLGDGNGQLNTGGEVKSPLQQVTAQAKRVRVKLPHGVEVLEGDKIVSYKSGENMLLETSISALKSSGIKFEQLK